MEKASEMAREAPKHMKWEPTHFTGLSLKLKLRLPCLHKFRFVFVREDNRKEEKGRTETEIVKDRRRAAGRRCRSTARSGENLKRTDPKHKQMCVSCRITERIQS